MWGWGEASREGAGPAGAKSPCKSIMICLPPSPFTERGRFLTCFNYKIFAEPQSELISRYGPYMDRACIIEYSSENILEWYHYVFDRLRRKNCCSRMPY